MRFYVSMRNVFLRPAGILADQIDEIERLVVTESDRQKRIENHISICNHRDRIDPIRKICIQKEIIPFFSHFDRFSLKHQNKRIRLWIIQFYRDFPLFISEVRKINHILCLKLCIVILFLFFYTRNEIDRPDR